MIHDVTRVIRIMIRDVTREYMHKGAFFMNDKIYTILDLAEEFDKDKQSIRRAIARLKLESINKDKREYSNDPLKYNHKTYLELAKDFRVSKSDTRDTHNDTRFDTHQYAKDPDKDKLIEILERELKHSKNKLEKAEQEKEILYRLLSQQQQLSLSDQNKIKTLELKGEESERDQEKEGDDEKIQPKRKRKWYDFFKRDK